VSPSPSPASISSEAQARVSGDPKAGHLPFIDGLRALCALFVLVCHAWYQPSNGYYADRWLNVLGLSYGHLAVDVFIVISGFVIVMPITRRDDRIRSIPEFVKRRATRILPPYYAALALSIGFILVTGQERTPTVWDNNLPLTWQKLLVHLAVIHNLPFDLPGGSIGYQLWSIAVEWQIYLLVPLLILGVRRLGFWPTLATALAASVACDYLTTGLRGTHHWYVSLFLCGAGAARIVMKAPERAVRLGLPGLVLLVATLGTILAKGHKWFEHYTPYVDLCIGAGFAMLLAGLVSAREGSLLGFGRKSLSFPPLVFVGTFSYSLYLVHPIFLHAAWMFWRAVRGTESIGMFGLLLLSLPAVIGAAWVFYRICEQPFMSKAPAAVRPAPRPAA
jgi:peptidoglycan/LPS O-acetylase OafA/YrhL